MDDVVCEHCGLSVAICAVGACPGAPASFALLDQLITDAGPDWTRWDGETMRSYALRLLSQVVWHVGYQLCRAGDWLIEVAHPQQPPIEFDIGQP